MKLPFATPEELAQKYGINVTRGGIYLRSRAVKPPGTAVTLDLKLQGGQRVLYASAVVDFVTGQQGSGVSGMGLRFLTLDEASQAFIDALVAPLPHAASDRPPVPPGVGEADYTAPSREAVPQGPSRPTLKPAPGAPGASARSAVVTGTAAAPEAPPFEEPPEEPKRTGPIIGIDLGTTNSCAAYVKNNKPSVLFSREGYNTVPSILALNARGKLVVGHPAKGQMLTNPRLTVYGAKRLMGRAYESPIVRQIKDRFHYEIAPGPSGEAAVKLGGQVYSLQQISALILREVREIAQNQVGQKVSRAVITVPAYYNDNQRQAVREAGRLAGLHVERILNEPTAAALAYAYGKDLKERVLVYDLGGGTFDASVLALNGNVYEVISTGGDTFLGGIDFDGAIVRWLLAELEAKTGKPFQGDRVAMQRITDAAERAKCALSERREMRIHVPFIAMIDNQPFDLDVVLTRDKLVELTSHLVERTLEVCGEVLKAKDLTVDQLDEVILVGGQSRFPLVHEKVTHFFKRPPAKSVHPDEAVALGAALLAHSLGQLEGVVLIDVLPMAIGIGLPGGRFKAVLERNAALPASKRYVISTNRDDQAEIEMSIFQGESDRATDNEYLGTLRISGLTRGPRGSARVEVVFDLSGECLLKVKAKEIATGKEVVSTFSTRDTPETVKQRLQQGENAGVAASGSNPTIPANGSARAASPAQAPGLQPKRPSHRPVPQGAPPAAVAASAPRSGFMGWLKRLFSRT
ncbi:MAG TPA: TIGR02266 family protein [Myxococcales bacterium]|nr:TIGR02266 family protein [Myxococcales bacterium]